mgnify:FL=1
MLNQKLKPKAPGLINMIEKIYLDMDGVLCFFEKRWEELYDETPRESRDRKEFTENWDHFCTTGQFETLEWFPGGQELLKFIRKYDVEVEMLTSSGGKKYHDLVAEQKKIWLKKHGIAYKPNVVPGRKHKADYAKPNVILIDDTEDIIEAFNKAGGIGILHKDIGETLQYLEALLSE